jgi:hypothetical protein
MSRLTLLAALLLVLATPAQALVAQGGGNAPTGKGAKSAPAARPAADEADGAAGGSAKMSAPRGRAAGARNMMVKPIKPMPTPTPTPTPRPHKR